MIHNSIDSLIGNTPILRLNNIEKELSLEASLLAKLEYFNPAGSAKDRVGLYMLNDAESKGIIKEGATIIEPTSGNTGIGIAAVAAARGYKVILVMPDTMSVERQKLIRGFGAEVVLTNGAEGMNGSIEKAKELANEIPNSFIPGQFENPSNARAHYETTGPEIWEATGGNIDIFVCGVGTGGTITGIGRYLKEKKSDISIVAIEPDTSAVLSGKPAGAHGLQGIGAGFVPKVLDTTVYDSVMTVSFEDAIAAGKLLGHNEGILVGISSGAALHAAIELGRLSENKGKKIVVLLPDGGDKYLSTPLFED